MRRTAGRTPPVGGDGAVVDKRDVRADSAVSRLRVKVPATKPAGGEAPTQPYLRFDVRRDGILGKLTRQPVLHTQAADGDAGEALTVSDSLDWMAKKSPVAVRAATLNAFRWYRLMRSAGQLVSTASAIVGALLVALGAIDPKTDTGTTLLVIGIALTVVAVVSLVVSAWRAPAE